MVTIDKRQKMSVQVLTAHIRICINIEAFCLPPFTARTFCIFFTRTIDTYNETY